MFDWWSWCSAQEWSWTFEWRHATHALSQLPRMLTTKGIAPSKTTVLKTAYRTHHKLRCTVCHTIPMYVSGAPDHHHHSQSIFNITAPLLNSIAFCSPTWSSKESPLGTMGRVTTAAALTWSENTHKLARSQTCTRMSRTTYDWRRMEMQRVSLSTCQCANICGPLVRIDKGNLQT